MGIYFNPGNSAFAITADSDYVDKTGMIAIINKRINKKHNLFCISRPRRFGKSYAAQMLCAYYDHTCDSHAMFDGREISKDEGYQAHLNQYQVIYLDMTNLLGKTKPENLVQFIEDSVETEILTAYPDVKKGMSFDETLINAVERNNMKFIMIIDEWDAPIRETPEISETYLNFLRMLFKSSGTTAKIFAAAYMTGILPIKKSKGQSAVSDFDEYSILAPKEFAPYTGFTEEEVRELCEEHSVDFRRMKYWYDGYSVGDVQSVYNPYSVMKAIRDKRFDSFWRYTSAADSLLTYINVSIKDNDTDGLQESILRLIDGETLEIDSSGFKNDVREFSSRDDVLTLLVHLGYLAYRREEEIIPLGDGDIIEKTTEYVSIPNEEIRREFKKLLPKAEHEKLRELLYHSEQLYKATLDGDEAAVAEAIKAVQHSNYAPTFYNDEQALRYVIKFAYITCVDKYLKIEELPSGHGIADVVYLPQKRTDPAIIVELKWNKSGEAAIRQIKSNDYPAILKNYVGEIILVGIDYHEKTDEHSCRIEKISKISK